MYTSNEMVKAWLRGGGAEGGWLGTEWEGNKGSKKGDICNTTNKKDFF